MEIKENSRLAVWDESSGGYLKTFKNEQGKRQFYLEYSYHGSMMTRATAKRYKDKFPTYKDVSVEGNIKDYNYFVEWSRQQVGFGKQGWVLDKDVLFPKNKIYSEETCVFIPAVINSFYAFVKTTNTNEFPFGVSWCESENKFKAYCSQLNGKNKTLGRFDSAEQAGESYRFF